MTAFAPRLRRRFAALAVMTALALTGAACGSDEETDPATTPTEDVTQPETTESPEATTESTEATTSEEATEPEETTEPQDTTGDSGGISPPEPEPEDTTEPPEPGDDSGGVGPSGGDPGKPDSPDNDVTPEANSPEAQFDAFCNENPEACG